MSEIFKAGCSRIPVYGKDRNELLGLILVKDLLFIDSEVRHATASFFSLSLSHCCFSISSVPSHYRMRSQSEVSFPILGEYLHKCGRIRSWERYSAIRLNNIERIFVTFN